jgi:hypothetical protein
MTEHLFALRAGAADIKIRGGPSFGHRHDDAAYRFVADEDHVDRLKEQTNRRDRPKFRWISTEKLDGVLESAEEAVAAIEAGEHDDVLDLLLVAERERYGNRVTVVDAIDDRAREIQADREVSGGATADLSPADVAPYVRS